MIEKNIHFLWFLLPLLCLSISACGFKAAEGSAPTPTTGTLHGTVTASPVCPVETPDDTCRPRPVPNKQVQIKGPDGRAIIMTTDQQGTFSMQLRPGRYVVEVLSVSYPMRRRVPVTAVSVVAGQTAEIDIPLDTGIR